MRLISFLAGSVALILSAAASPFRAAASEALAVDARAVAATSYNIQNYTNAYSNFKFTSDKSDGDWSVTWQKAQSGDFVVGKGYKPDDGIFKYSGEFVPDAGANAYLALYGWGSDPYDQVNVIEWYIIESMGIHNPSDNRSATQYGVLESDGGQYEIWMKPNYDGTNGMPFNQYWSIRTTKRVGGTITYGNHFDAWNEVGLGFGGASSWALSVEGQGGGGGHANITVGVLPDTEPIEEPTSTYRSVHGTTLKTTATTWAYDYPYPWPTDDSTKREQSRQANEEREALPQITTGPALPQ